MSCATDKNTGADYFSKDPDSVLDFESNWTKWMADGDTIVTSSWTVPVGLTKTSESHTGTTATVWLSGGTLGEEYEVVNRITTAQGRTEDQTLHIYIEQH